MIYMFFFQIGYMLYVYSIRVQLLSLAVTSNGADIDGSLNRDINKNEVFDESNNIELSSSASLSSSSSESNTSQRVI